MRRRGLRSALALAFAVSFGDAALAEGWSRLGYGRLVNNDFIGDLQDRDQSGSYVSSRMYARGALTALPTRAGEVLELRVQGDIKAPDNLRTPAPGDRPYAGSLSLGVHTHYEQSGYHISMGGEVVATGPQTGLDVLQTALHDALGVSPPSAAVKNSQIGNAFYPGAVVEIGRPIALSGRTTLRPFIEGRAGVETLIRAGMDLSIGQIGSEAFQVRDGITGQRYRTVLQSADGLSFVVGFDTAKVSESQYLPAARSYTLTDTRDRARMGVHWQGKRGHGFFGVTYLGKEYTSQDDPQLVGSLRIGLEF